MVVSMTGYGSASITESGYKVIVELKSLNSKFLEVNLKLPRAYMEQEIALRKLLGSTLKRGKINAIIEVEPIASEAIPFQLNEQLIHFYDQQIHQLNSRLSEPKNLSIEFLLGLPGALQTESSEADPIAWELIQKTTLLAIDKLIANRKEEGKSQLNDLKKRVEMLANFREKVQAALPERKEKMRTKLITQLNEIQSRIDVDKNRFEQELLYYIEKWDVNEEIVRLEQHLSYFEDILMETDSQGKKLSFITQEMGREINTIGAKANDAAIQRHVVGMKDELEKIKEQLYNVV